ncbi:MAG: polyprenol monophosphomannose synthase [Planctomycetes bacterium]|nr:polyprenol monophosphomannose synthase [Planctomycetota bacterium]
MRVLIVVPTYNERDNAEPLARAILENVPEAHILFVDDNSPDGTSALVETLGQSDDRIRLHKRPGKLGLGTAYVAGFHHGLANGYDIVVTMDADFSHDPKYLPALIGGTRDVDLMVGSRYVPGGGVRNWGIHRRVLSRFANFYARTLLGIRARDCTAGFRAYRVQVLRSLPIDDIRSSGYSFLEEMMYLVAREGFTVGETPIIFEDRRAGQSKISKKEIFLAAYHVLRLRLRGFRKTPSPSDSNR